MASSASSTVSRYDSAQQRQSENLGKSEFTIFTSLRYDPILTSSNDNDRFSNRRRCPLYHPELHRQRLWKAACKFWPSIRFPELQNTAAFETALLQAIEERERLHETFMCPMKVKYTFSSTGRTTVELAPVPALSLEALFPTTLKLRSEKRSTPPTAGSRFSPSSPYSPTSSRRGSEDYFSTSSSSSHKKYSELGCTYEIWIDSVPTAQDSHTSFKTSHRPQYTAARARSLPSPDDVTQEVLLWNETGHITEGSLLTPYFYRKGRWVTPAVEAEHHGGQRGTSRRWALEQGLCEEGFVGKKSIRVGERVWLSNGVRGFGWGRIQAVKRGDSSSENSLSSF